MEKSTKIIIASSIGVVLTTALVLYVKNRRSNSASNRAFHSDVATRLLNQPLTQQSLIRGATDAHNSSAAVAQQASTPILIHY